MNSLMIKPPKLEMPSPSINYKNVPQILKNKTLSTLIWEVSLIGSKLPTEIKPENGFKPSILNQDTLYSKTKSPPPKNNQKMHSSRTFKTNLQRPQLSKRKIRSTQKVNKNRSTCRCQRVSRRNTSRRRRRRLRKVWRCIEKVRREGG